MIKMGSKRQIILLFIFGVLLFNFAMVSSLDFGYNTRGARTRSTNYSSVNVNNSEYLQGYVPSDFVAVAGDTMSGNLNMDGNQILNSLIVEAGLFADDINGNLFSLNDATDQIVFFKDMDMDGNNIINVGDLNASAISIIDDSTATLKMGPEGSEETIIETEAGFGTDIYVFRNLSGGVGTVGFFKDLDEGSSTGLTLFGYPTGAPFELNTQFAFESGGFGITTTSDNILLKSANLNVTDGNITGSQEVCDGFGNCLSDAGGSGDFSFFNFTDSFNLNISVHNDSWTSTYNLTYSEILNTNCPEGNYSYGFNSTNGTILCRSDEQGSGGGNPGGANNSIQFNQDGNFQGADNLLYEDGNIVVNETDKGYFLSNGFSNILGIYNNGSENFIESYVAGQSISVKRLGVSLLRFVGGDQMRVEGASNTLGQLMVGTLNKGGRIKFARGSSGSAFVSMGMKDATGNDVEFVSKTSSGDFYWMTNSLYRMKLENSGELRLIQDDQKMTLGAGNDVADSFNGTDKVTEADTANINYFWKDFIGYFFDNDVEINGDVNVSGSLTTDTGYTGTCVNTTFVGGIAVGCND